MRLEPVRAGERPRQPLRGIVSAAAEAEAVRPVFGNVQFHRHFRAGHRGGKVQTVLHRHRLVISGVPDETRRRVAGDLQFVGKQEDEFRRRIRAEQILLGTAVRAGLHRDDRITQDAEVRPRTHALNGIRGIFIARIKMREQRGRQMAARRRTHDADAVRVNAPFAGACADGAQRARGVVQHRRMMIAAGAEPVFQDEARDAVGVEPQCVVFAFVRGQSAVAAAGTNDDGCAASVVFFRQKNGERGNVFVRRAECTGCAVWPERERNIGLCVRRQRERQDGENEEKEFLHGGKLIEQKRLANQNARFHNVSPFVNRNEISFFQP